MGIKEVVNAPGKSLSLGSKFMGIINLVVGQVFIGTGIWPDLTPWGLIMISCAIMVMGLPVDVAIIIKTLKGIKKE